MASVIFGSAAGEPDELGRAAGERDGALALLTGLAANSSLATGRSVRVADLVELPPPDTPAPDHTAS
jgi:hypothetical protein